MSDPADTPNVVDLAEENRHLRELLTQHQELDRLQGNRILELMRECGQAQAKLRAEINLNATLRTQIAALQKGKV